ncbi:MAG: monovalent cation/H(+) antiporter subunit G [Candidatus Saliniplasma sp.]
MIALTILYILLAISVIFNGLGIIGLHRFPDVYTRLHAATKCTTFGTIFMTFTIMAYGGVMYYWHPAQEQYLNMAIHTFVALLAILVTNPTGAHALSRAAHRIGVLPEKAVVDHLADKEEGE